MRPDPIDPIPAEPPLYGLWAAARVTVRDDTSLAGGGLVWAPEGCGQSERFAIGCLGDTVQLLAPENPGLAFSVPFGVGAAYECSPFGMDAIDFVGRAERQLEVTQSYETANELWTGDLAKDEGWDDEDPDTGRQQRYLSSLDSDRLTSTAADPVDALGLLEGGLAQCAKGRRGMIHVTPQLLVHLKAAYVVEQKGNLYLSPLGNIVVPDAGYDGSGPGGLPAGATQYAYATGIVDLFASTVDTIPGSLDSAIEKAIALDREDNTVTVWSHRVVMYRFDPCCHLAAEVDLPVPAIGGPS